MLYELNGTEWNFLEPEMELSFPIPSSQDFNYGQNLFDSQELRNAEATRFGDPFEAAAAPIPVGVGGGKAPNNLMLTDNSINTDVEENL
jgi:hypothetical protein